MEHQVHSVQCAPIICRRNRDFGRVTEHGAQHGAPRPVDLDLPLFQDLTAYQPSCSNCGS